MQPNPYNPTESSFYKEWMSNVSKNIVDMSIIEKKGYLERVLHVLRIGEVNSNPPPNELEGIKSVIAELERRLEHCNKLLLDISKIPKSKKTKSDSKSISISEPFQTRAYNVLKDFFSEDVHQNLRDLLAGKAIKKTLTLKEGEKIKDFLEVFRDLVRNKKISSTKTKVIEWLHYYFKFHNSKIGSVVNINSGTAKNILVTKPGKYHRSSTESKIEGLETSK